MVDRQRLTPVICAASGAVAGYYFLFSKSPPVIIVFLLLALAVFSFFTALSSLDTRSRSLRIAVVLSASFAAGLSVGLGAAAASRNVVSFAIPEDKITAIEGVLLEDPRIISGGRAVAQLSIRRTAGAGGLRASGRGEIAVFFPEDSALRLREFGRGAVIFTEGRLRNTKTGWTYSAESMHIVKQASAIERMRTGIRLNLINRFDGKTWGGLALALLLGIKDILDTNLASFFRNAGCSYILALSGMHLAVLASLIAFLLKKPLGLKAAAVTGAAIICLYCFLTGPMPSLNRAAIMYLLGVLAVLGALPKEPLSILALSFLIQIVISPAEGNTISFILSYLALAGIIVIGRSLYSLFSGKAPDFILQPLSASCGAFIATAGITSSVFGVIFPMGIITGLILVPLITIFMIGSMIWLALDMVSLSGFLNVPLSLLYQLMEKIVSAASGIPGVSATWPFVIYALSFAALAAAAVLEYRRRAALLRLQPFA